MLNKRLVALFRKSVSCWWHVSFLRKDFEVEIMCRGLYWGGGLPLRTTPKWKEGSRMARQRSGIVMYALALEASADPTSSRAESPFRKVPH